MLEGAALTGRMTSPEALAAIGREAGTADGSALLLDLVIELPSGTKPLSLRGDEEKGVLLADEGPEGATGTVLHGEDGPASDVRGADGTGVWDWIFFRSFCEILKDSEGVGSMDGRGSEEEVAGERGPLKDAASLMMLRRSVLQKAQRRVS